MKPVKALCFGAMLLPTLLAPTNKYQFKSTEEIWVTRTKSNGKTDIFPLPAGTTIQSVQNIANEIGWIVDFQINSGNDGRQLLMEQPQTTSKLFTSSASLGIFVGRKTISKRWKFEHKDIQPFLTNTATFCQQFKDLIIQQNRVEIVKKNDNQQPNPDKAYMAMTLEKGNGLKSIILRFNQDSATDSGKEEASIIDKIDVKDVNREIMTTFHIHSSGEITKQVNKGEQQMVDDKKVMDALREVLTVPVTLEISSHAHVQVFANDEQVFDYNIGIPHKDIQDTFQRPRQFCQDRKEAVIRISKGSWFDKAVKQIEPQQTKSATGVNLPFNVKFRKGKLMPVSISRTEQPTKQQQLAKISSITIILDENSIQNMILETPSKNPETPPKTGDVIMFQQDDGTSITYTIPWDESAPITKQITNGAEQAANVQEQVVNEQEVAEKLETTLQFVIVEG